MVSLKSLNSLKDGVKVEMFSLPLNDPNGGIALNLATSTMNVSVLYISKQDDFHR